MKTLHQFACYRGLWWKCLLGVLVLWAEIIWEWPVPWLPAVTGIYVIIIVVAHWKPWEKRWLKQWCQTVWVTAFRQARARSW